jgi:hypothetical protein
MIFDKSVVDKREIKQLSRYVTNTRRSWNAYLAFAIFFAGVVLKADVFRFSLISDNFRILESVKGLLESRAEQFFLHKIKIVDD